MGVDDRDGVAPTRRATDHLQEGTPQTFAELVVLVMQNSERLDALEEQLDALKEGLKVLQAWIAAYPPDRLLEDFAVLIRTEIDTYRKTAEAALKELATAVHREVETLRSGMTTGAHDAIRDLTEEFRLWTQNVESLADAATKATLAVDLGRKTLEGQAAILERVEAIAEQQAKGQTFDQSMEQFIATYRDLWAEQKAEQDARRAREEESRDKVARSLAADQAARLVRERRKAARDARVYKLGQAVAVPVLMSAVGTPLAVLTSLTGALPPRLLVALSVVVLVIGCSFAVYWAALRQPPEDLEAEGSGDDTLPPPPSGDGAGPPPPSVTTTTTTVISSQDGGKETP